MTGAHALAATIHTGSRRALAEAPHTLRAGDWKAGNLGSWPAAADLIGCQRGGLTTRRAVLGLSWYLAVNCDRLPSSKEDTIASYRAALRASGVEVATGFQSPARPRAARCVRATGMVEDERSGRIRLVARPSAAGGARTHAMTGDDNVVPEADELVRSHRRPDPPTSGRTSGLTPRRHRTGVERSLAAHSRAARLLPLDSCPQPCAARSPSTPAPVLVQPRWNWSAAARAWSPSTWRPGCCVASSAQRTVTSHAASWPRSATSRGSHCARRRRT